MYSSQAPLSSLPITSPSLGTRGVWPPVRCSQRRFRECASRGGSELRSLAAAIRQRSQRGVGRVIHLNRKPVTVARDHTICVRQSWWAEPGYLAADSAATIFHRTQHRSRGLDEFERAHVGEVDARCEREGRRPGTSIADEPVAPSASRSSWRDGEFIQSSPGGHLQVMQPQMYQVAAMVGVLTLLILIVSCANVGGLMLARAVTRQHEIGIRIAIGAGLSAHLSAAAMHGKPSPWGLWFDCGIGTGLCGAQAGTGQDGCTEVAKRGAGLAGAVVHGGNERSGDALFFGLMPALQNSAAAAAERQLRGRNPGRRTDCGRVQIPPLIVAALLLRATQHALYVDPGFGYEQVISVDPQLGRHGYSPAAARAYLSQMQSRMLTLPE